MARIAMALVCFAWAHGAEAGDAPSYRLEVGQEFVYRSTSEYRYEAMLGLVKETIRHSAETRLWVIRKGADGSVRLCVRHTQTREDEEPETEFGWCDLHPDGRATLGGILGVSFDPSAIFKPLPPAGATEWQARGNRGERLRLRLGDGGAIEESVESGRSTVGGATCTSRCVRRADGLPERIETAWSKGKKDRRTTTTVLAESARGDPAAAATLDRELASYGELLDRWALERLRAPDEAAFRSALKRGVERARALRKEAESPVLREELERWLAADEQVDEALVDDWRWQARRVGKPAPDWTLDDLDGKRHALKDYRGKVVVLDFWYAECGPCLMAMPVLKEVAARHKGKVALLGMNKDADPEEARRVAAAMELDYPTLRARETVGRYEVAAFPTMFVVDGEGIVRRVFVGFGPSLAAELEATVQDLLPG